MRGARRIRPRNSPSDAILALLRGDLAHQVLELEDVDRGAVDQARKSALGEIGVPDGFTDRLHDRVAPKPRRRLVEAAFRSLLTDERNDPGRMQLNIIGLAGGDLEIFRLPEVRVDRIEPLRTVAELPARHDVNVGQPALLDALGIERLRRIAVIGPEDERAAAVQPRQDQGPLALGFELVPLLFGFELFDVGRFGLPVAPRPRHVERRDVDDLANQPGRAVAGLGLRSVHGHETVEQADALIDGRSHARHDVGQAVAHEGHDVLAGRDDLAGRVHQETRLRANIDETAGHGGTIRSALCSL
jgi:hypothetical protein